VLSGWLEPHEMPSCDKRSTASLVLFGSKCSQLILCRVPVVGMRGSTEPVFRRRWWAEAEKVQSAYIMYDAEVRPMVGGRGWPVVLVDASAGA
jgi:hypothetical protein